MTYYRRPGSIDITDGTSYNRQPAYNEIVMGNLVAFDISNSYNFMLPPHYITELVMEMAKLIGVRLRDPNLAGFAAQEEASE